jgi:hypothetical protein
MESILKTTLLEYEKSAFIIELVEHNSGNQYIKIQQTITDDKSEKPRAIKLNPALLADFIKVLTTYQGIIPDTYTPQTAIIDENTKTTYLSIDQQSEVQRRYLIGVSIADLSLQFDCEEFLIYNTLLNNGIELASNKISKYFKKPRKFK